MPRPSELVLVANTRMPSDRAQALQVAQVAGAFARAGVATTLMHARRSHTKALPGGETVWEHYGVTGARLPAIRAVENTDWIDRVPRALQFLPARVQELSFARNAARVVLREHAGATVLSRELETARHLVRAGVERVFLEVHRVPGGRLRRAWLREAAPRVAGILAISGGVRDDLIALGLDESAIRVEHDGYEPGRFAGRPDRAAARRELGLEPDAFVVVYTGGLLEWKGVDVAIDAVRGLDRVQLLVAGGMPADVERVRAHAQGAANVRIDGFQPPARVATYLAAADLGVVPNRSKPAISARYTSPLKVFEYLACGLPIVASDLPSLRDILVDGVTARLCVADDPRALRAVIQELEDDEASRAALAANGLEAALEHTWDARAERILEWMGERS